MVRESRLPPPDCRFGYPDAQLIALLGNRVSEFHRWMRGQTVGGCDGREYDHSTKEYRATNCGPHGIVVYGSDLSAFLAGRRPLD